MTAKYVVFEGTEGVGKTTQAQLLVSYLRAKGYKVLQTREPGTPLSPLTMEMRKLMLDVQFDAEMTQSARELISQAIRSVHVEQIVIPALDNYDFIIQDRGILSGLAYGEACGNNIDFLLELSKKVNKPLLDKHGNLGNIYDKVVYLTSDKISEKLEIAKSSKQEFEAGDAIEQKGSEFMGRVSTNMDTFSQRFNTVKINIDSLNIDEVFDKIISSLNIK